MFRISPKNQEETTIPALKEHLKLESNGTPKSVVEYLKSMTIKNGVFGYDKEDTLVKIKQLNQIYERELASLKEVTQQRVREIAQKYEERERRIVNEKEKEIKQLSATHLQMLESMERRIKKEEQEKQKAYLLGGIQKIEEFSYSLIRMGKQGLELKGILSNDIKHKKKVEISND